ncbi:pilus assembly protein CpaD [Novosphingobium kunmingense]|uniref:Pilus assembly protein CpaD n=1 Tax=Novosphingobium kunmingense TaxID=1211806 RepID=A0A2N0HKQ1_9SPHN|nr:CpaD family pilus assembly protein [Novosphingobium kunmingense]PKB19512.1 pilus assembly protein CpaD [Novosphingobium kunmingense]
MGNRNKRTALTAAITLSLGLALSGCGGFTGGNTSLESVHQPVVERTNYTLDVTSGPGGLSLPEQRRLAGWFEAMDLRYGDKISLDDPLGSAATLAAVESVAGRYGMLVSGEAPVTPGAVNAGTVRVVVTRTTASVPGCPDWSRKTDVSLNNATSTNYGCATNSNFASMVADPEHLLKGAAGSGQTVVMSSTKAIDSYREAKPTGEGGLKAESTKDGK